MVSDWTLHEVASREGTIHISSIDWKLAVLEKSMSESNSHSDKRERVRVACSAKSLCRVWSLSQAGGGCRGDQVATHVVTHPSRSSLSARGDYLSGASTIVPSNDPLLTPVASLTSRVTVKLPVAPANRPVPPVMA